MKEKILEKFQLIRKKVEDAKSDIELEDLYHIASELVAKYWENNILFEDKLKIWKTNFDSPYSLFYANKGRLTSAISAIIDNVELTMESDEAVVIKHVVKGKADSVAIQIMTHNTKISNNKVFIVHGHNEVMKQSVARTVEKLDLEAIILHEQANQGMTIIEKFVSNSDVGFALILLSADDMGYSKKEGSTHIKERARQNVIFELGFFTAKLGRARVVALVEDSSNFEKPSDIDGVIYIPFDGANGKWKFDVVKELKTNGYELDANKIM